MTPPATPRARDRRRLHIAAFCFAVALVFIVLSHFVVLKPLMVAEFAFQDRMLSQGHKSQLDERVLFVGIDEASLILDEAWPEDLEASAALRIMQKEFPWSREVYALLLDRLVDAGAAVVAFDLLLDQPREGDEALAAAIQHHADKVVIGVNFASSATQQGGATVLSMPSESLIEWPEFSDPRIGFVNVWPDLDGKIRSAVYRTTVSEVSGEEPFSDEPTGLSLMASALRHAGLEDCIPPGNGSHRFRFTEGPVKPIPLYSIFVPAMWEATFKGGEVFRDKIVVIGPAAARFHDFQDTAKGSMLGPELHANMLLAAMDGAFYKIASPWVQIVLILGGALLAWGCVVLLRHPLASLGAMAGFVVLYVCGVWVFFEMTDYLVTGVASLATLMIGGVVSLGYEFALERVEKTRIRGTLERYVSRNVVREILDNKEAFLESLGGTRKQVTILFSDVRGFTSKSEGADPAELVAQLNEYLGAMVEVVFRNDGTVDKFIGDAVMAVWGNVSSKSVQDDARLAVTAALEMNEALAVMNDRWEREGREPFRIGIGLNHGEAIFGNIGSEQKMEPTVIGDPVNLASRVEGLTKEFKSDLLITGSVAGLLDERFVLRTVSNVAVKGKEQPVDIFMVLGRGGASSAPGWLADYEEGIRLFRGREFSSAAEAFGKAAGGHSDFLIEHYVTECERFTSQPPGPDWTGSVVMAHK